MDENGDLNLTPIVLPYGQSDFDWAGLTPSLSEIVQVPFVVEALIAFECKAQRTITASEEPAGGSAVLGEVQCIHVREDIYDRGYILLEALIPIGRLAGSGYTRIADAFETVCRRPPDYTFPDNRLGEASLSRQDEVR